ncbi:Protein of uncharacterised function (DUF2845) [Legionella busanensis]|uniref:Protein of uncharacterized function (DUF2845) n=1 Tax=Legionella busanensis TaxID=190655 RepID=A0A378JLV3_9GAMM|nr:DUF2845 domain-containing protein [Legionella busanensis]STX52306.1 Protein of uncharacterised function (DUF2845) [Legionella busanensis]
MYRRYGVLIGFLFPLLAFSQQQSVYCPQNHGFINIGMSQTQVMSACGQPLSKQQSNQPFTQKVPVQQLIYNNQGDRTAFYGVWALPIGNTNYGGAPTFGGNSGGGAQLQVNIMNNKVSSITMNGSSTNAFSICGGRSVEVGDPVSIVYNACGTPSLVNHTYINQVVPSSTKPEIWVYQADQYQKPMSLTFVDGKLQSID